MEERAHGSAWTPQELMVGLMQDVGDLGRLAMAAESRWLHGGDLPEELGRELSECLWWVLVLADRLDVDIGVPRVDHGRARRRPDGSSRRTHVDEGATE